MAEYQNLRPAGESDLFETFSLKKRNHVLIVTLASIPMTTILIAACIALLNR